MKTRLYNARILPFAGQKIFFGEVIVEDGQIASVQSYETADANKSAAEASFKKDFDKEIDCGRNLLMSSFCNAHTHAAMCLFRGIADDLPLEEWLYKCIFPMEKYLTEEDVYWGTMLQIAEFARGGITCFADMYFYPQSVYAAAENAAMRLALCCGLNSYSKIDVLKYIEKNYNLYCTMPDKVQFFPGLHAEYTCDEKLIESVADFAVESGARTYIHLSETLKEVGECTVRHNGLTPPQYLHKVGFFDNGGLAAHCVYADKDDLDLLRESNVVPVINSASNLKLASGVAPVYSMLAKGMKPALGTDGTASNNAASMFREMYLYSCLQKFQIKDASAVSAEDAISAAAENGFAALNFRSGKIEKGWNADLVLIDLFSPNMQPLSDISKNIVFSADVLNVLMTVSSGKIIYDRGRYFIGESPDKIYSECEKRKRHIQQSANL